MYKLVPDIDWGAIDEIENGKLKKIIKERSKHSQKKRNVKSELNNYDDYDDYSDWGDYSDAEVRSLPRWFDWADN